MSDLATANVAASVNGNGYLTPEQMEAGALLEEADVHAYGGKVRVRELSAAESAKVQQAAVKTTRGGQGFQMSIPDAEILKFQLGMIAPRITDHSQAMRLYQKSGRDFRAILAKIDELSGTTDDALEDAKASFQGSEAS